MKLPTLQVELLTRIPEEPCADRRDLFSRVGRARGAAHQLWLLAGVMALKGLKNRIEFMIEACALKRLELGPVDLRVRDGECASIMGRSGSGKSVLLRMIADLDPHLSEVLLDDVPCSSMAASTWRSMVTHVPAESGWWAERAADHFPAEASAGELLPAVGVPAAAFGWPVARLSTGERQRLALVRALRPSTRVLLLDEPTSGLDAASVGMVEAILRRQLAAGTSIVLVTHDAEQALRMAGQHFQVRDGLLCEEGR